VWSAAHIYMSALPFAAKDSLIYKMFTPLCVGLISIEACGINRHGGSLIMTLSGHDAPIVSLAYSYDGRLIGTAAVNAIHIWDTRTGEEAVPPLGLGKCYESGTMLTCIAFSPKGNIIAAGTNNAGICIWSFLEIQTCPQKWSGPDGNVISVAFASDGARLASASKGNSISIWQIPTGDRIMNLNGHTEEVSQVVFSPDCATLASCSDDTTVRLWHVVKCQPFCETLRGHEKAVRSICFSHDGSRLASGCRDGIVQLWDTQSRTIVATLNGHSSVIRLIQFLPGRHSLIWMAGAESIRYWNQSLNGAVSSINLLGLTTIMSCVAFSPDGLHIAATREGELHDTYNVDIWDVEDCQQVVQPLLAHNMQISSVAVSPDNTLLVSDCNDSSVHIWDTYTGEPRLAPLIGPTDGVESVSISSNLQLIAAALQDYTIWLWNIHTREPIGQPLRGHEGKVLKMAFSPDSRRLISGSSDKSVRIWEAATGQQVKNHSMSCPEAVNQCAFCPNGRIVATGTNRLIYFWHTDTGRTACEPLQADIDYSSQICFSPDGNCVAFVRGYDAVHLWDITTPLWLRVLESHGSSVTAVAYSFNGRFICTGSSAGTVHLWNVSDGAHITTLHGRADSVRSVAFTPDGRSIVSQDNDTIRIWDGEAACRPPTRSKMDPVAMLASAILDEKTGWLLESSGDRLVWVPQEYQRYLQISPCTLVIGKYRIVVRVGGSGWHHGENWFLCWKPNHYLLDRHD